MEKAIYGVAAIFDHPTVKSKGEKVDMYTIEPSTVQYYENVAFSLHHEPKQTITTTKNKDNGQLILVQKGKQLFFKFIPTTKDGERIFRYVKQRKLRQCSYSYYVLEKTPDDEIKRKVSWALDPGDTISKAHVAIFEVCLTNNPADEETFCTTDKNHPLFRGIEWKTNVELAVEGDYWEEKVRCAALDEQLEQIERDLERSRRKTKKLLKKRGILI